MRKILVILIMYFLAVDNLFALAINSERNSIYGPYVNLSGGYAAGLSQIQTVNVTKTNFLSITVTPAGPAPVPVTTTVDYSVPENFSADEAVSSFDGFVAFGYEYIWSKYFIAVEGNASLADLKANFDIISSSNTILGRDPAFPNTDFGSLTGAFPSMNFTSQQKIRYLLGVDVRFGYLFFGDASIYLNGGVRFFSVKNTLSQIQVVEAQDSIETAGNFMAVPAVNKQQLGVHLGIGNESFISVYWSLRSECGVTINLKKFNYPLNTSSAISFGDPANRITGSITYQGTMKDKLYLFDCQMGVSFHVH